MHSRELVERVEAAINDELPDYELPLHRTMEAARAAITATLEAMAEHFDSMGYERTYAWSDERQRHDVRLQYATEGWGDKISDVIREIAAEVTPAAAGTSDATEAG